MNVFKKLSEAQIPAPIHTARGRPCPQPEGGLRVLWTRVNAGSLPAGGGAKTKTGCMAQLHTQC